MLEGDGQRQLSRKRLCRGEKTSSTLVRAAELALQRLDAAIEVRWRDYYLRARDPRLDDIRGDPRFAAMMTAVRADVDRQRVEVERRDAAHDFMVELDAERAERK